MRHICISIIMCTVFLLTTVYAQERTILVPKQIPGAPFVFDDSEEYYGQAYRWFLENQADSAVHNLKKVIEGAGYELDPKNYYIVVAHFMDEFAPMGILHENTDFYNTRLYGLKEDNLYYIFISRSPQAPSFISLMATAKSSPFLENLPGFLGLFGPFTRAQALPGLAGQETWVDIRKFTIPKSYQKFSDLSIIVKEDLSSPNVLASAVFDNTSLERWSYGIALAVTSADDVDLKVGSDGKIIIRPKPSADVAGFGVINYHLKPVDTKAKTIGTSIHLLGGLRMAEILEPIIGIGGGISLDVVDIHLFAGYSLEFANKLKSGYQVGQNIDSESDPFKLNLRGKPRFGIELKFP